jgi:hypothetical protein
MRYTPVSQPAPRRASIAAVAVLGAALLSIPSVSFAQAPGPHGPGMQGGMPGGGPGMHSGAGDTPRLSRHAERFMMLYDLNGDGKVSIQEINDDQARMFNAMDVNGDKSMSVDEIRRRGRSLQIFRTTTLFDLLDANGDGKLAIEEIQSPSKRWFKRYDKNGDGVMEASEIPSRRGLRGGGSR